MRSEHIITKYKLTSAPNEISIEITEDGHRVGRGLIVSHVDTGITISELCLRNIDNIVEETIRNKFFKKPDTLITFQEVTTTKTEDTHYLVKYVDHDFNASEKCKTMEEAKEFISDGYFKGHEITEKDFDVIKNAIDHVLLIVNGD